MINRNIVLAVLILVVGLLGIAGFLLRTQIEELIVKVSPVTKVKPSLTDSQMPAEQEQSKSVLRGPVTQSTGSGVLEEALISFDGKTFNPMNITIKKGETVKFLNVGQGTMWVASAPHPVHTDYPGFDQKTVGISYDFTFNRIGKWKYHNHTPFISGGTITVIK